MHCKSCEMLIKDELGEIPGVKTVEPDHKTGTVKIGHEGVLDTERVNAALSGLGFRSRG